MATYHMNNKTKSVTGTDDDDLFVDHGNWHGILSGEGGDDLINLIGSSYDTIDGGSGFDTIRISQYALSYSEFSNIELLIMDNSYQNLINMEIDGLNGVDGLASSNLEIGFHITGNGGSLNLLGKIADRSDLRISARDLTSAITLRSEGGNDTIQGSAYDDIIYAGEGDDKITIGKGFDNLYGEYGKDTFFADYNSGKYARLFGGEGIDSLLISNVDISFYNIDSIEILDTSYLFSYSAKSDINTLYKFELITASSGLSVDIDLVGAGGFIDFSTLVAAQRNVVLSTDGLTSASTIIGTAMGDRLDGSEIAETFEGGAGSDQFYGAGGIDTASYANSKTGITATLGFSGSVQTTGDAAGDYFSSVENLIGSAYSDRLYGNEGINSIFGGNGADTAYGEIGADKLFGQDGNDTLIGGVGADYLSGGTGLDTASYASAVAGVIAALANIALNTGDAAGDTYSSIENLAGSNFADQLNGNGLANVIAGNAGNDKLKGYTGDDRLLGGDGDDVLIGDAGADYLGGGNGSDTVSYAYAAAGVIAALANTAINTGEAAGDTFSSIENLIGTRFDDALNGNSVGNLIQGGAGNDRIKGYAGNDTLTGGSGSDAFIFHTELSVSTNVDAITDFNVAADTIWLDNAVFDAIVGTGVLRAGQFAANAAGAAQDLDDRIVYETDTGKLFYDTNGSAQGGSFLFATLTTGLALTSADFLIF